MQGINQKNQKKSTQKHAINQVSNNKFEPASETAARNLTPPPFLPKIPRDKSYHSVNSTKKHMRSKLS